MQQATPFGLDNYQFVATVVVTFLRSSKCPRKLWKVSRYRLKPSDGWMGGRSGWLLCKLLICDMLRTWIWLLSVTRQG